MTKELWQRSRGKWIKGASYLLLLIGAAGFVAPSVLASGAIVLPSFYELPAGNVIGAVTGVDGKHIVPLVPSGRVQIYDSQWHFIRGWNVDASQGYFNVRCSPDGIIEVFTARNRRHYSFTQDGRLISSESYSGLLQPVPGGQSVVVPTSPLLWIFSSPFFSWVVWSGGIVGLIVAKKMKLRSSVTN